MLAVVGATATATVDGQPSVFVATAGAAVVAEADDTTTSAVSSFPASSVTVSRTVNDPDAGATTVAVAVFAPMIAIEFEVRFVHAYVDSV
jgi:hypothetical protein